MTNDQELSFDSGSDAIIAGTLCLMSCYAQHPAPAYAARIASNLTLLSDRASMTAEFRSVCRRMASRWVALQADAVQRGGEGAAIPDTRILQ